MKLNGLITTLHSLIFQHAYAEEHFGVLSPVPDPFGESAVLSVSWSEKSGDSETWTSELWEQKAPNIFQAMSSKK